MAMLKNQRVTHQYPVRIPHGQFYQRNSGTSPGSEPISTATDFSGWDPGRKFMGIRSEKSLRSRKKIANQHFFHDFSEYPRFP